MSESTTISTLNSDEIWSVIDSYFACQGIVKHQIDSFHELAFNIIPSIVTKAHPVEFEIFESHRIIIQFTSAYFGLPQHDESNKSISHLTPNDCRIRHFTYQAPLYSDIELTQEVWNAQTNSWIKDKTLYYQLPIAYIPIMVQSSLCLLKKLDKQTAFENKECIYDQGGYFIINGIERVLIAQERMGNNRIYVFSIKGEIFAEIRSISENSAKTISILALKIVYDKNTNEPILSWSTPSLKKGKHIPLLVLFYALDILDKSMIYTLCGADQNPQIGALMFPSEEESFFIHSQQDAFDDICLRMNNVPRDEKKVYAIERFMSNEILPHVSCSNNKDKAIYLGLMVQKLCLCLLGKLEVDDRDHYGYKRLDLASNLMGSLFRQSFTKMTKQLKSSFERQLINKIDKSFNFAGEFKRFCEKLIGKDLCYCLGTGNWTTNKHSKNIKTGVAQQMNRLAYMSSLSYLRRVNAPIPKEGKMPKPRQLHNSQFGIICCAETPEGEGCGIIKSLAMMTDLSVERDVHMIRSYIMYALKDKAIPLTAIEQKRTKQLKRVFVNGLIICYIESTTEIRHKLINLRRKGFIAHDISIVDNQLESSLYIQTDAGRCIRPLLTCHENKLQISQQDLLDLKNNTITWIQLISQGKIEYLDVLESENALIATKSEQLVEACNNPNNDITYTHCEIHAAMIIGICASIIPMANHNQSPRNTYESSMCKQSMSIYAMNYQYRFDTAAHVMCYPQKPLTPTKTMKYFGFEDMPAGQNIIAAIACFTGYNQEDSVLLNKAAVERGIFRSIYFKSTIDQEVSKTKISGEKFGKPDPSCVENKNGNSYHKIDESGFPDIGVSLKSGDIMIGKIAPMSTTQEQIFTNQETSKFSYKDSSTSVKPAGEGIVDSVVVSETSIGKTSVKIKVRQVRIPEPGDKFASCNGQKGTCGLILAQEDMPYTASGITPDLIMNVHAIPSRMTIGQLLECVMSKTRCVTGRKSQSTAFESSNIEEVSKELLEAGFQQHGKELMYHPATGRQMEALIFIGPTYYQRLKHMVQDKMHARAHGPKHAYGRQPTEGRSREGGFRFGEMERDVLIAHGAANLLKEKLCTLSDHYTMPVCQNCGLVCYKNQNKVKCEVCEDKSNITMVEIPYACKLLFQELMAMNIAPRINVNHLNHLSV